MFKNNVKKETLIVFGLLAAPFFYFLFIILPIPFGNGLQFSNDFPEHRIWWLQNESFFLGNGYFPLWNPTDSFGELFPGWRGWSLLYPLNSWLYLVTIFLGGKLNYYSQYVSLACHSAIGLFGLYKLLYFHGKVSRSAAVLGAIVFLLNQRFNDFVRYPNGIEAIAWAPWIFYFALKILRGESRKGIRSLLDTYITDYLYLLLFVSLMWLAGYGTLAYLIVMAYGILCFFSAKDLNRMIVALSAFVIGMTFASGQLLATSTALRNITLRQPGNIQWAADHPLGVSYLEMFTHPFNVDITAGCYILPVFVTLCLLGLIGALFEKDKWQINLSMLLILILMADLSRGLDGFLFEFFHAYVPKYYVLHHQGRNNWISLIPFAWFCAMGAERCFAKGLVGKICMSAIVAVCFALVLHHFFTLTNIYDWSPLSNNWIDSSKVTQHVLILTIGSTLLVLFYLIPVSVYLRIIALLGLVVLFVSNYAIKATYFENSMNPIAEMSVSEMFGNGLFAFVGKDSINRLKSPVFISEFAVNPLYDSYKTETQGQEFPGSRFQFLPKSELHSNDTVQIQVDSYGPNHFDFTVKSDLKGELLFFSSFSEYWKSNVKIKKGEQEYSHFTILDIDKGTHKISLSYRPYLIIAFFGLNIIQLGILGAVIIYRKKNALLLIVEIVFFSILFIMFLYGAFSRHSFNNKLLYGKNSNQGQSYLSIPIKNISDH